MMHCCTKEIIDGIRLFRILLNHNKHNRIYTFAINTWLYSHTAEEQIDAVLTITSLLGGSLGIVLSFLLVDRKAVKENVMSRVFVICVLVVQVIAFLMFKGYHQENITCDFWDFFGKYKALILYLLVINLETFIVYGIDKYNAIEHRSRIRIVTLFGPAFIGGSIGGL